MSIQEIVAYVYGALMELRGRGQKPSWVLLNAERYRELQCWHRQLGELPAHDYIDPDHLFDIPIALDNSVEFAVLDASGQVVQHIPRQREQENHGKNL